MRALATGALALALAACRAAPPAASPAPAAVTAPMVRHVVAFRFKPTATAAQIDTVTRAIAALKDQIPGIVAFEHGVNNSPEGMNQGMNHVYVFTFVDAAARDAYLPHPAHKAFGALLGRLGIFDGVFVVDYVPTR